MDSSFITLIDAALALYAAVSLIKLIIQFGLPNHPARFVIYLVSLCMTSFFSLKVATDFGVIDSVTFLKYRPIPLVAGGLGILMQMMTTIGRYGYIQQKIFSRVPLIGAIMVFAFFPTKADPFLGVALLAAAIIPSISVGKARYQKRMLFKMGLFFILSLIFQTINFNWSLIIGELFLFFVLFYFFILQQSFGVMALVEKFQAEG